MTGSCYVPGCNTGYTTARKQNQLAGKKNPSLFFAPKDPQLLAKWQVAIPRKDKPLTTADRVCELHFSVDSIEDHFTLKLFDGSIFALAREKKSLKPGSVPSIFPFFPKYLQSMSNKTHKRKAPSVCTSLKKKQNCMEEKEILPSVQCKEKQYIYKEFLVQVKNISTPDSWWSVATTEEYVMFAKWDSKFSLERRVVIRKDLSMKVFLKNTEVKINIGPFDSEKISDLLKKVNDLKICEYAVSGHTRD